MKKTIVSPLLKKLTLDKDVLKNYRPVSNLSFISKTLEKIVSSRLLDHIESNNLAEPLQSAYKRHHGTETALLKIQSDLLLAMDDHKASLVLFLDRYRSVHIKDNSSKYTKLNFGVPKGSVLGPLLFSYYTKSIRAILVKYN